MPQRNEVVCDHCGHLSVEYNHNLNKSVVAFLILLFEKNIPLCASVEVPNYTKRCNSQKLTYWNFIEPWITKENKRKRGWWVITERGKDFMRGEIAVQKTARTKDGAVIGFSGPKTYISDVCEEYKYRGDWADEARQQIIGF